ncbi:transposase family protein [Paenibacillus sp. A14]|uniref:transposase family protein n=1 Tax=Paenibacillus sp. A14 TaxID=3119820 RepID=UPI002FE3A873
MLANHQNWHSLSDLKVRGPVVEYPEDLMIPVERAAFPAYCPYCGSGEPLYKHGCREQVVLDLPVRQKHVSLVILRKRYKCRNCGAIFWEELSNVDRKRRMTKRLVKQIQELIIADYSFVEIANFIGVHEKTVRNIYKDCFTEAGLGPVPRGGK